MIGLIREWRDEAANLRSVGSTTSAAQLERCIKQLEEAWHQDRHDGQWYPDICAVCREEMEEHQARNPSAT